MPLGAALDVNQDRYMKHESSRILEWHYFLQKWPQEIS